MKNVGLQCRIQSDDVGACLPGKRFAAAPELIHGTMRGLLSLFFIVIRGLFTRRA